jgi:hypothetical protein
MDIKNIIHWILLIISGIGIMYLSGYLLISGALKAYENFINRRRNQKQKNNGKESV